MGSRGRFAGCRVFSQAMRHAARRRTTTAGLHFGSRFAIWCLAVGDARCRCDVHVCRFPPRRGDVRRCSNTKLRIAFFSSRSGTGSVQSGPRITNEVLAKNLHGGVPLFSRRDTLIFCEIVSIVRARHQCAHFFPSATSFPAFFCDFPAPCPLPSDR